APDHRQSPLAASPAGSLIVNPDEPLPPDLKRSKSLIRPDDGHCAKIASLQQLTRLLSTEQAHCELPESAMRRRRRSNLLYLFFLTLSVRQFRSYRCHCASARHFLPSQLSMDCFPQPVELELQFTSRLCHASKYQLYTGLEHGLVAHILQVCNPA
ncbi:MAG: hypothetical protein AB7O38_28780, partial [Pirellulaceae bacterium]